MNVQEVERVRAGEPLMDGPSNPHDILNVLGEKALQSYLVNEIREVYRLQGVNINDKHIETIARQMMRWVKIENVGDTEFLVDQQVDKFRFLEENERVIGDGGRPAQGHPPLLFVEQEFRDFLRCGCLAGGFARFRCDACGLDRLVPCSCFLSSQAPAPFQDPQGGSPPFDTLRVP